MAGLLDEDGEGDSTLVESFDGKHLAGSSRIFGDYELIEEIAHGGMGVVWRAQQRSLRRTVAVKMLLLGQFASESAIQRFKREAAAAASLRHPAIVTIHDVGEVGGQHYFSMEFVDGRTLADALRDGPLPARLAAEYCRTISEAVAYAHQRGIIHRDLKPSNILIDMFDQPRVTDFGLAKVMGEGSDLTLTGQVLGSPNYFAPELAAGKHREAGFPSDIFSLGAVLYECLTGRPPFMGENVQETLLRIRDVEPVAPRTLNHRIPKDLETICLKCLEKEPDKRYTKATDLSEELGRFLDDKPILARPISFAERVWRWGRRKPELATALGLATLIVVGLLVGGPIVTYRINEARNREAAASKSARIEAARADAEALSARANVIRQYVANGNAAADKGNVIDALPWFSAALELETDARRSEMHQIRLATSIRQAPRPTHRFSHSNEVYDVSLSQDGRYLASASADRTARVWDLEGHRSVTPPLKHVHSVHSAQFSKDGRWLLTHGLERGTQAITSPDQGAGEVRLWEASTGRELWHIYASNSVWNVEFSPDESLIVYSCSDGTARLVRPGDGSLVREFKHPREVRHATISPNGQLLATSCRDHFARVWDLKTGELKGSMELKAYINWNWEEPRGATFSPDSKLLLAFGLSNGGVWDVESGKKRFTLETWSYNSIQSASFSPDQSMVLTAMRDATVSIRRTVDGEVLSTIRAIDHFSNVQNDFRAAFTPNSQGIVSWSRLGPALWGLDGIRAPVYFGDDYVWKALAAPDGRRVFLGCADGSVRVWDFVSEYAGAPSPSTTYVALPHLITPDGKYLLIGGGDGELGIYHASSGETVMDEFPRHPPSRAGIYRMELDGLGKRVLTMSRNGLACVFDIASGQQVTPFLRHPVTNVENTVFAAFSPDGNWVVSGDQEGVVRIWSIPEGKLIREWRDVHSGSVNLVVSHTKSDVIATIAEDRTAILWKASTMDRIGAPLQLEGPGGHGAISPDGKLLLVGCWKTGDLTLWNIADGRLHHRFPRFGEVHFSGFSPDGSRIVTGWMDGFVRVWSTSDGALIHAAYYNGRNPRTGYSPDGRFIAAAGSAGLSIRDAETGEPITPSLIPSMGERYINGFSFSPDSQIVAGGGGYGKLWNLTPLKRSAAEWSRLALAFSGKRIDGRGSIQKATHSEVESVFAEVRQAHPEHFQLTDKELAEWLWRKGEGPATLRNWVTMRAALERIVAKEPANSHWRRRLGAARLEMSDLRGAMELNARLILPARDSAATVRQIDLEPFYNALTCKGGWGPSSVDFSELPRGTHLLDGVAFDLRGAVRLGGSSMAFVGSLPRVVSGIPMRQVCSRLHMLHGVQFAGSEKEKGLSAGKYVLNFVDGQKSELPLIVGEDVDEWWFSEGDSDRIKHATRIWKGETPMASALGRRISLWKRTYLNPRPGVEISSIDFVSSMVQPAPFLVAMTVE